MKKSYQEEMFDSIVNTLGKVFAFIFRRRFGVVAKKKINAENYWWRWNRIEQIFDQGGGVNFSHSVSEADKLIDHLMRDLGVPGETMADRLKTARRRFSPGGYHKVWEAHKLRNKIAHEHIELNRQQTQEALLGFKKALGELMK